MFDHLTRDRPRLDRADQVRVAALAALVTSTAVVALGSGLWLLLSRLGLIVPTEVPPVEVSYTPYGDGRRLEAIQPVAVPLRDTGPAQSPP